MSLITGTIKVLGRISPTDTTDIYATHTDIYGQGGLQSVADGTAMSAITSDRRKDGMMVYHIDTSLTYQLQGGTGDTFWTLFSGAGSTSGVHNDLSGLQGGTSSEYYHLLSSDYTTLRGGSSIADSLHQHTYSGLTNTGHGHTVSEISDFDPTDYTTDSEFNTHTGTSTIHFTVGSIDHGSITGLADDDHPRYSQTSHTHSDYTTDTEFDTHTGTSGIHFTVASIDIDDIISAHTHPVSEISDFDPTDYTTDSEFNTHTGTSNIHFTEASIDIANIISGHSHDPSITGDILSGGAIDGQVLVWRNSEDAWSAETQEAGVTDHTLLSNIGTNTHSAIDDHITSGSVHFTEATIDIANIVSAHTHDYHDDLTNTGHTHTESEISDFGTYETESGFATHTGTSGIHFTVASLGLDGYTTDAEFDTHTGTSGIHFTVASIDIDDIISAHTHDYHDDLTNTGHSHTVSEVSDFDPADYTTDGEFAAHTGVSGIHFTEASIDHDNIANNGTNDHTAIDNHITSGSVHFTEATIDIDNIISAHTHDSVDLEYTNATPLEVAHGGYPIGSTFSNVDFQTLMDTILYPYQTPSFASFYIATGPSEAEVGETVLVGVFNFTWNWNNSQNVSGGTLDIYDVDNDNFLYTDVSTASPQSHDFSAGIQKTIVDTHQWKAMANMNDEGSNAEFTSSTETVYWRWARYYGSGASSLNASEVTGLTNTQLATGYANASTGYDMDATNYKWLCYPSTWGEATEFTDKSTQLEVPMSGSFTMNVTNQYGITEEYRLHRTLNFLGGAVTILVS